MLIKKIILSVSVTFLLLTPITVNLVDTVISPMVIDVAYALDFAGGSSHWNSPNQFIDITNVLFFTFFKEGIDPDCIDIDESKEEIE